MHLKKNLPIDVLALDLEATLISNVVSLFPRPKLYDFLEFCINSFPRIVIFTTVSENKFREVARWLVNEKYTPDWFADLEYINWDRHIKDLRFIPNTSPENVILVDDYSLYIHPEQIDNWIEIKPFKNPYSDSDRELIRVKMILEQILNIK